MADSKTIINKYFKPKKSGFIGFILNLFAVKDAAFDAAVKDLVSKDLPKIKPMALEKLGVDESEVAEIKPITFSSFNYDSDTKVKKGKDGKWRSNAYQTTYLFFSKDQLFVYRISYFLGALSGGAESTEEYFYKDITNFSTSQGAVTIGNEKVTEQQFQISVYGDKFTCWVRGDVTASINGMKKLLREKKTQA